MKNQTKQQLNTKICKPIIARLRSDAVKFNKSVDNISETFISRIMSLPETERAKLYKSLPTKRAGRKQYAKKAKI